MDGWPKPWQDFHSGDSCLRVKLEVNMGFLNLSNVPKLCNIRNSMVFNSNDLSLNQSQVFLLLKEAPVQHKIN